MAEDRISPRRGAVLAYVNSWLLRTLPAIHEENPPQVNDTMIPKVRCPWGVAGVESSERR